MRLEYVHISGYKNLIDTRLVFETSETPITIIGNNGTGKSNLIEALLHIFVGLYYGKPPEFDFHIKYAAHNKQVEVQNSVQEGHFTVTVDGNLWSHAQFNRRVRNPQQMPPFPSQVFTYYSGTCDRVENIIRKYNRSYLYKLKTQSDDLERQFVFSDISQAEWILLGLFAHRHRELLSALEIDDLDRIKLTLQPPESYVRDSDDPVYWGTEGGIREFLSALDHAAEESYSPFDGHSGRGDREARVYRLRTEQLERLGAALERRGANLYSMLKALAAKNMLIKNEFEIVQRLSQTHYLTEFLSEGEKQLLCVIGGLTLAQNTECLVLLDEPDTHLNPAWSWRYNSLLKQALTSQQRTTSTTILATHDPIMISGLRKNQVFIAQKENERLIYEPPVRDPRGQGVANILVSEYFGLPSSLDEDTQMLLDERLRLAYKQERLTDVESARLSEINSQLDMLGLSISFRDPAYKEFEEQKFSPVERRG
jgi:predicted ATPase